MTAHPSDKRAVPHPETGWAKARRPRERGVRTCLPAVVDRASAAQRGAAAQDNIVRGED
ncbi:hypothetical protein LK07_02080 [Streptomyces pluripotens]|uniref:Uncharacterized protein n=1 Tax=Streptomyces pluripotens TaxID=1355015 RepID=A0A221NSQ5_9ACTN|nr:MULTISPECIES: hypothetical protein [Streptomyces]ASN23009.1 hypothetical protein LK07_02080 [Streptomyces pluripotens]MCH0558516.1 hypothetical protein [Streptomyces sp. MUM 16J]